MPERYRLLPKLGRNIRHPPGGDACLQAVERQIFSVSCGHRRRRQIANGTRTFHKGGKNHAIAADDFIHIVAQARATATAVARELNLFEFLGDRRNSKYAQIQSARRFWRQDRQPAGFRRLMQMSDQSLGAAHVS